VFTWGWNGHGQLGSGGTAVAAAPRAVEGLLGRVVAAVACGGFHTLAATTSGRLFAWGLGRDGQLGTGLRSSHVGPIAVEVEDPIVAIAAGHAHSAAVSKSGYPPLCFSPFSVVPPPALSAQPNKRSVCYTFGCGRDGRLGHGSQSEEYRPRAVKSLARVVVSAVTCGYAHTAALGREGSIWTCGKGQYGALGHGERTDGRTFRQVLAMGGVVAARVSCGGFHTAAVTVGGECFVWGDGSHHQLPVDAIDAFKPAAVRKFGKRAVTGVASGYRHTALCVT
jgi:RCC1 and BTB domain-containing protein